MLTDEQVYKILQEFRQGEVLSVRDGIMLGRYLIRSTYGVHTITEKLNKLLENKPVLKPKELDPIELMFEVLKKLDKIQEQLTSFAGENKKEITEIKPMDSDGSTPQDWSYIPNKCEGCPYYGVPMLTINPPCKGCFGWLWRQQYVPTTYVTTTTTT